jgi:hypothetical protein
MKLFGDGDTRLDDIANKKVTTQHPAFSFHFFFN